MIRSSVVLVLELLICGFQTLTWIVLLIFVLFGIAWINPDHLNKLFTIQSFLVIIVTSYSLGVIFDRVWDFSMKFFDRKIRDKHHKDKKEVHEMRMRILTEDNDKLMGYVDYIRSRMRIARASIFNFAFITINLIVFLDIRLEIPDNMKNKLFITVSIFGAILFVVSSFAWWELTKTYHLQLDYMNNELLKKQKQENDEDN